MGDFIFDAISESVTKWVRKAGKPVFGIGCLIAAVLLFVFAAKEGLGYISYMSKPNRFFVDESISYEDLSERRGGYVDENKRNHEYLVTRTYTVDGELVIDESKNILKNPYDNTPVFYEMNDKGQKVPVRIRFYTLGRWLSILFNGIITVMLPLLIGAFLRWCSMEEGETFMEGFHPLYGAAWYTLTAFIVLLYFVKGVRKDAYDHPIIYQLFSNGKTKLIGKRRDRKLSVLSMFGIGSIDKDGKRLTVFRLIHDLGGLGIGMALIIFFIFLGSTLAMVF